MQTIDTLIDARWIVPVVPDQQVLENHSLAIHQGRILALLPWDEAHHQYQASQHLRLHHHTLIPGLVNAHTHAAMSLLRGLADDLPLMTWLQEHIWPTESQFVGDDFVRDGTELAMVEMLRGGTTCFNDMYFFPETVAETVITAGMRACVGLIVVEFPTNYADKPQTYLDKGLALHRSLNSPLLRSAFAPHAPYTVADGTLTQIAELAADLQIPVHMHVHETAHEVEEAMAQNNGQRPLARLAQLGLVNERLLAVHMTQLTGDEIQQIAVAGVRVAHCPESNLKLASGFCPSAALDAAGIQVAIGTDGAASNNDLDMFGEMRSAALVGKAVAADPTALAAHRVLTMATLFGARALGLEKEIGSLEVGKAADVVAVDMDYPETTPLYDVVSQLIYACGRHQVSHVWVAGKPLLDNRELTTLDQAAIRARTQVWQQRIGTNDAQQGQ